MATRKARIKAKKQRYGTFQGSYTHFSGENYFKIEWNIFWQCQVLTLALYDEYRVQTWQISTGLPKVGGRGHLIETRF